MSSGDEQAIWQATARMPAGSKQNRPSPGSVNQSDKRGRVTMRTRPGSEVIDQDRRQLLSTVTMGIAAVGAASLFPAYPAPAATSDEIRPFLVNVPEEGLVDLRRRINATRWPDRETVTDESQGVQLATIQEVARYWGDRLRLAQVRGETERPAAIHDRDRWTGYSFHSRSFET